MSLSSEAVAQKDLSRGIRRRCDPPVDENLYKYAFILKKGTFSDSTNCYFLVKNESFMVFYKNQTLPGDKDDRYDLYTVDLKRGRDICAQHQAHLPIIQTKGEQEFLLERYAKVVDWILLGMQRKTYEDYVWDNKHSQSYKPKKWVKINGTVTGTYNLLMSQYGDGRWSEFFPNQTWTKKDRFGVVCHQRGYGPNGDWYSDTHPTGPQDEDDERAQMLKASSAADRKKIDIAKSILLVIVALIIF